MGISQRTTNEHLLKLLDAYQSAVNEAAIVSITDADGTIIYANKNFIEISGYTADEIMGSSDRIVNSGHHDAHFFKDLWQTISAGKSWRW